LAGNLCVKIQKDFGKIILGDIVAINCTPKNVELNIL
jgi:hypothetical protein